MIECIINFYYGLLESINNVVCTQAMNAQGGGGRNERSEIDDRPRNDIVFMYLFRRVIFERKYFVSIHYFAPDEEEESRSVPLSVRSAHRLLPSNSNRIRMI